MCDNLFEIVWTFFVNKYKWTKNSKINFIKRISNHARQKQIIKKTVIKYNVYNHNFSNKHSVKIMSYFIFTLHTHYLKYLKNNYRYL